jgi:nicotinamide mononucleotide (NMN) deamidase PncC
MCLPVEELVRQIHASPTQIVLAISGGGAGAISGLTGLPGASRTVIEAVVPYSAEALVEWLGGRPDQCCAAETARRMAMAAFLRASRLGQPPAPLAGVACTASLATDRPKRGIHRAHVAIQTVSFTATRSLVLKKGHRDRPKEEQLITRLVLNAVAEACGLKPSLDLGLADGEDVERSQTIAPPAWQSLLLAKTEFVRQGGPPEQETEEGRVIFPGAFNPLHAGHRGMAKIAEELLGRPVEFEISILNPDKPPLDYCEIKRRTGQFGPERAVWLTRASTFVEKARLFPGATFVVGTDTARRIADPRYYGDDESACRAALGRIAARGCHFLVFGRSLGTGFISLHQLELPEPLWSICREVPGEQFREDVSSTELRRAARDGQT